MRASAASPGYESWVYDWAIARAADIGAVTTLCKIKLLGIVVVQQRNRVQAITGGYSVDVHTCVTATRPGHDPSQT